MSYSCVSKMMIPTRFLVESYGHAETAMSSASQLFRNRTVTKLWPNTKAP